MSQEEWGPWIEHDGNGCPCVGEYAQVEWEVWETGNRYKAGDKGITEAWIAGLNAEHPAWSWKHFKGQVVSFGKQPRARVDGGFIRYRVRKPRGLTILEGLLTGLPEKVDA